MIIFIEKLINSRRKFNFTRATVASALPRGKIGKDRKERMEEGYFRTTKIVNFHQKIDVLKIRFHMNHRKDTEEREEGKKGKLRGGREEGRIFSNNRD